MSHFFIYLFCYVAKVISENWNLEAHGFSLFPRNNTFVCELKTLNATLKTYFSCFGKFRSFWFLLTMPSWDRDELCRRLMGFSNRVRVIMYKMYVELGQSWVKKFEKLLLISWILHPWIFFNENVNLKCWYAAFFFLKNTGAWVLFFIDSNLDLDADDISFHLFTLVWCQIFLAETNFFWDKLLGNVLHFFPLIFKNHCRN